MRAIQRGGDSDVYNQFMSSMACRRFRIGTSIALFLALIAVACTPAAAEQQSAAMPAGRESAATLVATGVPTLTATFTPIAGPQPTDSPAPASPTAPKPTSATANPSPVPPIAAPAAAAGPARFVIDPAHSTVSYGVGETFLKQGNRFAYAVGVTSTISGEIAVDSDNPAASTVGEITVDISAFQSDSARRDKAIRDRWLQSSKFPLAVFSPTELRGLPQSYTSGDVIDFEVAGDLLVRDVSHAIVLAVSTSMEGERLSGTATARVQMTDFGFDPPTVAGMVEAENDVDITFEFVALPAP